MSAPSSATRPMPPGLAPRPRWTSRRSSARRASFPTDRPTMRRSRAASLRYRARTGRAGRFMRILDGAVHRRVRRPHPQCPSLAAAEVSRPAYASARARSRRSPARRERSFCDGGTRRRSGHYSGVRRCTARTTLKPRFQREFSVRNTGSIRRRSNGSRADVWPRGDQVCSMGEALTQPFSWRREGALMRKLALLWRRRLLGSRSGTRMRLRRRRSNRSWRRMPSPIAGIECRHADVDLHSDVQTNATRSRRARNRACSHAWSSVAMRWNNRRSIRRRRHTSAHWHWRMAKRARAGRRSEVRLGRNKVTGEMRASPSISPPSPACKIASRFSSPSLPRS